jgi:hypothetical protein
MERILLDSCPAELAFKEPIRNKMEMISQANSKRFNENPDIVKKTMNKEDRYSPHRSRGCTDISVISILGSHNPDHGIKGK